MTCNFTSLFKSVSVISGRLEADDKRLSSLAPRLSLEFGE